MHLTLSNRRAGVLVCVGVALSTALVACGQADETPTPRRLTPTPVRSALTDSIRARTKARLAQYPDTIGMQADSGRIRGAASARVWLVVHSDFQCTSCRTFALDVLPQIQKEFVEPGLVRVGFINTPQDDHFNARFAAAAALCAATAGRFWEMHDALFAKFQEWDRNPDPRAYFNTLAVEAGVPAKVQGDCIARNLMLRLLSEDMDRSQTLGVAEVPTVFVAERRLEPSDLTLEGIRRALRAALGERVTG